MVKVNVRTWATRVFTCEDFICRTDCTSCFPKISIYNHLKFISNASWSDTQTTSTASQCKAALTPQTPSPFFCLLKLLSSSSGISQDTKSMVPSGCCCLPVAFYTLHLASLLCFTDPKPPRLKYPIGAQSPGAPFEGWMSVFQWNQADLP